MGARLGALILIVLAGGPQAITATPDDVYAKTVQPFLASHCIKCHGAEKPKGGIRFDRIKPDDLPAWQKTADQLAAGEMPPAKEPRPSPQSVAAVRAWIGDTIAKAAARSKPRTVLRRLNRTEYDNTIRDLFGLDLRAASRFPEDDTAHGFDTIGSALTVSPLLLEKYMAAAEMIVARAVVPTKPPEVFKKRWIGTQLAYGKLIKELEAAGRKPEDDAVIFYQSGPQANGNENLTSYQIPYALPRWKSKLPGEYIFRVKASAVGCGVSEKLKGKIYYEAKHLQNYPEGPMGVLMKVTRDGELVGRINVARTPEVYEVRAYFEAGQAFEYQFENGPPNVNVGRLEVLKDYPGPGLQVHWIEIEGPVGQPPAFSETIERFASRAYRRPVRPEELADLLAVKSIPRAVELALCSPSFLYLTETGPTLNAWEVASRLSYFLWSTMPDEALFKKAADGTLLANLDAEVKRMLADPKAAALTKNFAAQWLHLHKLDAVAVDPHLFPYYTDYLRTLFRAETDAFFEEVLRKDLSILNFIDSDFAMLNDRLAIHYGIEGVVGPEIRKVPLAKGSHRGGLLGQAGILTLTTCGTQTSPVMRGRWVLECLLGTPPPPPPKDVPALPGDVKGTKTIRERLAKHREDPSCAGCHDRIDPYGLALENFSVVGLWRTDYSKPRQGGKAAPVDAAAILPTGEAFEGPEGVKDVLLKRKDRFARGFVEKMLTYALGRGLEVADRPTVDALVAGLEKNGYKMSGLIRDIVRSDAFRSK